jgi:hypothetical protein
VIDRQSFGKQAVQVTYIFFIISLLSTLLIPAAPPITYAEPVVNVNTQNGNQQNQPNQGIGQQQPQNQRIQVTVPQQQPNQNQPNQGNQSQKQKKQPQQSQQPQQPAKKEEGYFAKITNWVGEKWNVVVGDDQPKTENEKKAEAKAKQEEQLYDACGSLELVCKGSIWLIIAIKDGLLAIGEFLKNTILVPGKLVKQNEEIERYVKNVRSLAWSFLELFVVFQGIRLLATSMVVENHTQIKAVIQKLFITAILLVSLEPAFNYLSELNEKMITAMLGDVQKNIMENLAQTFFSSFFVSGGALILSGVTMGLFHISIMFLVIVMLFIVIIHIIIRNAELALVYILGPIAIVTNMNEKYNYFHIWWKHLLMLMFTTTFQVLLLSITLRFLTTITDLTTFFQGDILFFIGFLILTLKVPNLLKEWIYSSEGASTNLGRVAGKLVSNVIRRKIGI